MNGSKAGLRSFYFKISVVRSYAILRFLFLLICYYLIKNCINWIYAHILPPLLILKDFSFFFFFLKVFSVKLNSRQNNHSRILALDMVHFFSLSHETKPSDLYGFKR